MDARHRPDAVGREELRLVEDVPEHALEPFARRDGEQERGPPRRAAGARGDDPRREVRPVVARTTRSDAGSRRGPRRRRSPASWRRRGARAPPSSAPAWGCAGPGAPPGRSRSRPPRPRAPCRRGRSWPRRSRRSARRTSSPCPRTRGPPRASSSDDAEHGRREERHPGGAVGLLERGRRRAAGCERSKTPMLSRPRKPPANRLRPSASLRLTHQVKLSRSFWNARARNVRSRFPAGPVAS